jgi:hypothetical protein
MPLGGSFLLGRCEVCMPVVLYKSQRGRDPGASFLKPCFRGFSRARVEGIARCIQLLQRWTPSSNGIHRHFTTKLVVLQGIGGVAM